MNFNINVNPFKSLSDLSEGELNEILDDHANQSRINTVRNPRADNDHGIWKKAVNKDHYYETNMYQGVNTDKFNAYFISNESMIHYHSRTDTYKILNNYLIPHGKSLAFNETKQIFVAHNGKHDISIIKPDEFSQIEFWDRRYNRLLITSPNGDINLIGVIQINIM